MKSINSINKKGWDNLALWLEKIGRKNEAQLVKARDAAALNAWQDQALRHAYMIGEKVINAHIEVGSWTTGLDVYNFDAEEIEFDAN